ncbi:MAG: SGNH/GDSL hydrolase family protein [Clostridia bacterium]|nr:SGNH/GDSL hydrolase family protein [Clostridia bacterium]
MKLTFEQIISATNGIVRTEQSEAGLELHRFTKEQEDFFFKPHPLFCSDSFYDGYFGKNCRTTAGITLDFISDAKEFKVEFGNIEFSKNRSITVHLFDLFLDDEYVKSYDIKEDVIYKSSGKKHKFSLCFPAFVFPIISSVELTDATVFLPQKKSVDVLFLGDSITHGARSLHPSNTYVMRVAKKLNIGIVNQGNSGFVYDAKSVESVCNPKLVITAYGINDFRTKNLQMIESETTEYIKKVKDCYKNAKVASILPLWAVWNARDENLYADKKLCIKSVYEKYSDFIIDGYDLIPHDSKYFADDVHPNDDGFAFYGENLSVELEKILKTL